MIMMLLREHIFRSILPWGLLLLWVGLAGGCAPVKPPQAPVVQQGPVLPMDQVVAGINANNAKIRTLWARVDSFQAWFYDGKKHQQYVNGDGTMMYRKPRDLRLRITQPLVTVLVMGSNTERYWLILPTPDPGMMWWGSHQNLGPAEVQGIPIRPDLILQVLGIGQINTDFTQTPIPTMYYSSDGDAYVFNWVLPAPQSTPARWIIQKQVWYDRASLHPTQVLLFDANGQVVLRAKLAQQVSVETAGLPEEQWPLIASDYQVLFPQSNSQVRLRLGHVVSSFRGAPNDAAFVFPKEPGVPEDRIRQVGEGGGS